MAANVVKSSRRGAAPGERRGGRKKGTPNKSTAELKALAGVHAETAIKALVGIAQNSESDAARVSAIKELLDRGFGRSTQSVDLTGAVSFTGLDVTIKR